MGKKPSPTLIGAFVVGAVALALIGVAVFGSGRFFHQTREFVIYFKRSVNGLRVGAPVKFKGVEIGSVKEILIRVGTAEVRPENFRIPVIIEVDGDRIAAKGGKIDLQAAMDVAIAQGMRAQLATESIVTGVLYVEIDFHPGTSYELVGDPSVKYPEIPTVPTALERVQMQASEFIMKLNEADLRGLIDSLRQAVDGVRDIVVSPKLRAALDGLDGTVHNLNGAIDDVRRLAGGLQTEVVPLARRLRGVSDKADTTVEGMRVLLEPGSPLTVQLGRALDDIGAAARSVRALADELERDPSALVRGRYVAEDGR